MFQAHNSPLERSIRGLHIFPPLSNFVRASKRPRKFRTRKVVEKLPMWKPLFWVSGIGGWSLISTWINPPPLGSNVLHCVKSPGKFLLNLNLGELLALLKKLSYWACWGLLWACCWRSWICWTNLSAWSVEVWEDSVSENATWRTWRDLS